MAIRHLHTSYIPLSRRPTTYWFYKIYNKNLSNYLYLQQITQIFIEY